MVELLVLHAFEPGEELKPEQMTKGEGDLALPMAVHVVAFHLHVRTMAQHPLDYGGHFGGRAAFELRLDADGFLFDMPIDHDPRTTVANMPLGEQVLIPCPKLLGVRGARRRAFAPNMRMPHLKNGIRHLRNRSPHLALGQKVSAHIVQIKLALVLVSTTHSLQSGFGAQAIQSDMQAFLDGCAIQLLPCRATSEHFGKPNT